MQDVTPKIDEGKKVIEKYGDESFTISGQRFNSSVITLPDEVHQIEIKNLSDIRDSHIKVLLDASNEIEILLVGSGSVSNFFDPKIEKKIQGKLSIEYMNTGAACRTYNILLSEGRKVAALLLAV